MLLFIISALDYNLECNHAKFLILFEKCSFKLNKSYTIVLYTIFWEYPVSFSFQLYFLRYKISWFYNYYHSIITFFVIVVNSTTFVIHQATFLFIFKTWFHFLYKVHSIHIRCFWIDYNYLTSILCQNTNVQ